MAARDVIVIGASAGGVEALTRLCAMLPEGLPASVFIVVHIPATAPSMLPKILSRSGPLPAQHPRDGAPFQAGNLYLAPPDMQMQVMDGIIRLSRGPLENGHRPAIDVLFRSAAEHYQERVVGVVLSGMLSDGSLGLNAIHRAGGLAIVQDLNEAAFPSMPRNALQVTPSARVLTLDQIAHHLAHLAAGRDPQSHANFAAGNHRGSPDALHKQTKSKKDAAVDDQERFEQNEDDTPRTLLTCPECGGVLSENEEGDGRGLVQSYRCHVGHRYSLDALIEEHAQMVERALWSAYRMMRERAMLTKRLSKEAEERGRAHSAQRFSDISEQAAREAEVIRKLIEQAAFLNEVDEPGENGQRHD